MALWTSCHTTLRSWRIVDSNKKGCILIRPPSVLSSSKPSKSEVMETKRIVSLRSHIKRVIGRLREFHILITHPFLNHNLLYSIDDCIIIAAAIGNIQSPIIKM